jgi:hypothetical protein
MSSDAQITSDAADLRARAAFDQQLWTLGRLAQAGLNIALAMEAQALAVQPAVAADQGPQPPGRPAAPEVSLDNLPPAPADLALAFARVSRAVRMTVALQARLLKADQGGPRAMSGQAPAPPPPETRARRARRAAAVLRRLIGLTHDDVFGAAELMERVRERLFDPDITGDLLDRPFADLITGICRDLGLSPDWPERAPELVNEAWARGFTPAAPPGPPILQPREAAHGTVPVPSG